MQFYSFRIQQKSVILKPQLIENKYSFTKWKISLPTQTFEDIWDLFLVIDYIGDAIELYFDDSLVWDDFNKGTPVQIGLRRWKKKIDQVEIYIVIKKISRWRKCRTYFEKEMAIPQFKWKAAKLSSIQMIPVHQIQIKERNK